MVREVAGGPVFENDSEQLVYERVLAGLGPHDAIASCVRFNDPDDSREIDVLVGLAGFGIAAIEVKGGQVWHDGGSWWMRRGGREVKVDPEEQARKGRFMLREWLDRQPDWQRQRYRGLHFVALPQTTLEGDYDLPSLPRWQVLDRADLDVMVPRLRAVFSRQEQQNPAPAAPDVALLWDLLEGRGLPQLTMLAQLAENSDRVELLTRSQDSVLRHIRALRRVEVVGGAGSGKTWLAVEQARRLTVKGERVALICYSRGLATYLRRTVERLPPKERPAYVGTFHEMGTAWGAPTGTDDDSDFWETRLPEAMTGLAAALPRGERFDAVVVDEAQDFAESWWAAVTAGLRDQTTGGLFCFSDERQRVFSRQGRPPVELVPIALDENLRNTKAIAQTFGGLAAEQMRYLGPAGLPVRFHPCPTDEALAVAEDAAVALLDEGWPAEAVALLTTGQRHPVQVERQAQGQDAYWASYWDDEDMFYGHVLGFKGLERPALVLAVNGFRETERAREMLYVGLSRARDLLVVCGDPVLIKATAGEGVLRRLRSGGI